MSQKSPSEIPRNGKSLRPHETMVNGLLHLRKGMFRSIRESTVAFGVWICLEVTLETIGEKPEKPKTINISLVVQIENLRI